MTNPKQKPRTRAPAPGLDPARSLGAQSLRASRRLRRIIQAAQAQPLLRKLGPKPSAKSVAKTRIPTEWTLEVEVIGSARMKRLNGSYRGMDYATDVLSFPAPDVFYQQGFLGELVICGPVLERQAKELGHSVQTELDVLLIHGVIHLLGLDHERGEKEAAEMARLEALLMKSLGRKTASGLIERSRSGKSPG